MSGTSAPGARSQPSVKASGQQDRQGVAAHRLSPPDGSPPRMLAADPAMRMEQTAAPANPRVGRRLALQDRAEQAAHDLAADLAADRPDDARDHRLHRRLASAARRRARAASRSASDRLSRRLVPGRSSSSARFLQHLVGRFAIDRLIVAAGERAAPRSRCRRSSGVTGPMREQGGRISVRSTIPGMPLGSRVDTSASPTPSSVITSSTSNSGLARNVCAAARTAFWSRGVKARRACWMRLPSCPRTSSGMSSGFCEMK